MAGALLTTVGGVYAQFTYAQGNVEQAEISMQKNLATAATNTEKGTINVAGNFLVSIDDIQQRSYDRNNDLGRFDNQLYPGAGR